MHYEKDVNGHIRFVDREFNYPKKEMEWITGYLDIFEYCESKTAYLIGHVHTRRNLLLYYCKIFNIEYLYVYIPYEELIDDKIFFDKKLAISNRTLNKELSFYFQDIARYTIKHGFCSKEVIDIIVNPIVDTIDIYSIEKTVNRTIEYLLTQTNTKASKEDKFFIKKLKKSLKIKKTNPTLDNSKKKRFRTSLRV